jgi:glycosyltransferase involved in cell wall biosynthesis
MLGRITDNELASLYREALAFVYPSEYEGFGLQICEAMVFGTPVLTSDRTSLPEILSTGGRVFSLDSDHQLVALMNRIETDHSFRDQLREQSYKRGQDFSWSKCAALTKQVYCELLNAKPER